jgi:molybdenum cofactor guanylyltransferase
MAWPDDDARRKDAMTSTLRAFLLAGGKASRMGGRNKAFLLAQGEPILARTLAILAGRMPVTVISDRAAEFAPFDVPVVADRTAGLGPLGGIETGLAATDREHNLFLACDLPYLSWPLLAPLIEGCGGFDVTLYRHAHYEPLVAVYARSCLPHIRALFAQGRSRPIDLLPLVSVNVLPIGDAFPFRNVNDLDDLSAI